MGHSNLLVVEDNALAAKALCRTLKGHGAVTVATGVAGARKALDENAGFDALFVDLGLPDGSGFDVIAYARGLYPAIRAMVITGRTDREAINRACELGAFYFCKPCSAAEITAFLSRGWPVAVEAGVEAWRVRYALTDTEAGILRDALLGLSRDEMIRQRDIEPSTFKNHVHNLLAKTGDDSLPEAIERFLREYVGSRGGKEIDRV